MTYLSRLSRPARFKSMMLVFVLLFDVISASSVFASQLHMQGNPKMDHSHFSLIRQNEDLSQGSPCHDISDQANTNLYLDTDENSGVGKLLSRTDHSPKMSCCSDDCAHCPAFLTLYQISLIGFRLSMSVDTYEHTLDVPIINGHPVSIYRPPTSI